MKHINYFVKHIPLAMRVGIVFFFMINAWAFAQNTNDSIARIQPTPPPAGLQVKDSLFNLNAIIDSLQKRQDVKTRIEITEKGDTITRFVYEAFDFGEIYTANSAINANAKKEPVRKDEAPASLGTDGQSVANVRVQTINQSKSVGQIPFDEGVTPTGGKTISIPILTATVASSAPQIALSYNSQMGNSMAGYGWNISGIPTISVTNKTIHYDGIVAPADISNPANCVFALDGTRLVTNNNAAVPAYHYETAQGYTLVKKIMHGNHIAYFEALFPDGSKATFGLLTNTTTRISYPLTSIVDIKGYRMDFEYISSDNMYFINKIKYGSKTTTHPAEIQFEYTTRTDFTTAYISNTPLSQNQLLKKITSYNNNQEIRTYSLTHTLTDEVNRLTRLDCSSAQVR